MNNSSNSNPNLESMRTAYSDQELNPDSVPADPLTLFEEIWTNAEQAKLHTANACTLATANSEGRPSARIVLLRQYGNEGFTFFTNYNSKKGQELKHNPNASLLFFWPELEVQIRIDGTVEMSPTEVSDQYFATRPLESQLGAWASPQSQAINHREELDQKLQEIQQRFPNQGEAAPSIPRPEFWGGYTLKPNAFEFWKGRPSRLHDRVLYQLNGNSNEADDPNSEKAGSQQQWSISRLAP